MDGVTLYLLFAREEVMLSGWTDRVYLGPGPPAIQVEGAKGATLELTSTNLPDTVLWNPWHKVVFFSYTGSSNCSLHNELLPFYGIFFRDKYGTFHFMFRRLRCQTWARRLGLASFA